MLTVPLGVGEVVVRLVCGEELALRPEHVRLPPLRQHLMAPSTAVAAAPAAPSLTRGAAAPQLGPGHLSPRSFGTRFQTARAVGTSDGAAGRLLAVDHGRGHVQLGVLAQGGTGPAKRACRAAHTRRAGA